MTRTTIWCIAALAAIAIASAHHLDPAVDDHSADYAQADTLQAQQADEAREERKQTAAQALCADARGPNSEARWTPEGHLVCTTRRGVRALAVAQAGQP